MAEEVVQDSDALSGPIKQEMWALVVPLGLARRRLDSEDCSFVNCTLCFLALLRNLGVERSSWSDVTILWIRGHLVPENFHRGLHLLQILGLRLAAEDALCLIQLGRPAAARTANT